MKKLLLSALLTATSLLTFNATAASLTFKGPVTINWTVYQSTGSTNHSSTNHTATTTNILTTVKDTAKQFPLDNASLIKLLSNSFNMTFPKGTQLVFDGATLQLVDKTGSNVVLDISPVLTVQIQASVRSSLGDNTEKITAKDTTFTGSASGTGVNYLMVNYDDSAETPGDGTSTIFEFDGLATDQASDQTTETVTGSTVKQTSSRHLSFVLTGAGNGTIKNVPSVLGGSVIASASGPLLAD